MMEAKVEKEVPSIYYPARKDYLRLLDSLANPLDSDTGPKLVRREQPDYLKEERGHSNPFTHIKHARISNLKEELEQLKRREFERFDAAVHPSQKLPVKLRQRHTAQARLSDLVYEENLLELAKHGKLYGPPSLTLQPISQGKNAAFKQRPESPTHFDAEAKKHCNTAASKQKQTRKLGPGVKVFSQHPVRWKRPATPKSKDTLTGRRIPLPGKLTDFPIDDNMRSQAGTITGLVGPSLFQKNDDVDQTRSKTCGAGKLRRVTDSATCSETKESFQNQDLDSTKASERRSPRSVSQFSERDSRPFYSKSEDSKQLGLGILKACDSGSQIIGAKHPIVQKRSPAGGGGTHLLPEGPRGRIETGVVPYKRHTKCRDFVKQRRRVCILELAIRTKQHEVKRVGQIINAENEYLKTEETDLMIRLDEHDRYLKSICQRTAEAIRLAEAEAHKRNEVSEKIKRARYRLAHLNAECIKLEEEYLRLSNYRSFLSRVATRYHENRFDLELAALTRNKPDVLEDQSESDRQDLGNSVSSDLSLSCVRELNADSSNNVDMLLLTQQFELKSPVELQQEQTTGRSANSKSRQLQIESLSAEQLPWSKSRTDDDANFEGKEYKDLDREIGQIIGLRETEEASPRAKADEDELWKGEEGFARPPRKSRIVKIEEEKPTNMALHTNQSSSRSPERNSRNAGTPSTTRNGTSRQSSMTDKSRTLSKSSVMSKSIKMPDEIADTLTQASSSSSKKSKGAFIAKKKFGNSREPSLAGGSGKNDFMAGYIKRQSTRESSPPLSRSVNCTPTKESNTALKIHEMEEDSFFGSFFTGPQDLVDILTELESNNLTLIENVQEQEEVCERVRGKANKLTKDLNNERLSVHEHIEREKLNIAQLYGNVEELIIAKERLNDYCLLERYQKCFKLGTLEQFESILDLRTSAVPAAGGAPTPSSVVSAKTVKTPGSKSSINTPISIRFDLNKIAQYAAAAGVPRDSSRAENSVAKQGSDGEDEKSNDAEDGKEEHVGTELERDLNQSKEIALRAGSISRTNIPGSLVFTDENGVEHPTVALLLCLMHAHIQAVYFAIFGALEGGTKLDTLVMLRRLETTVDNLGQLLDSYPRQCIVKAKRTVDEKNRVLARRKQKEVSQESHEILLKKAIEKAREPPRWRTGRRLVYRSNPPMQHRRATIKLISEGSDIDDKGLFEN